MGSVYNATTNDIYPLTINTPLILGRNLVNKKDIRISRSHVQIILLDDQRCFVKTLSQNACTLDNALLPKKINDQGKEEGEEIEAFNGQWIHLLPGNLYPFKLNLPKSLNNNTLPPRKPLYQRKDDTNHDTDSETESETNNTMNNNNLDDDEDIDNIDDDYDYTINAKIRYHYSSDDNDVEENDNVIEDNNMNDDSDDDSVVSTESSLIGEETWSD